MTKEMQSATYLTASVRSLSGEQFLSQYKLKSLSDQDFKDMWRRYDQDDSGFLDMEELRILLSDLLAAWRGLGLDMYLAGMFRLSSVGDSPPFNFLN